MKFSLFTIFLIKFFNQGSSEYASIPSLPNIESNLTNTEDYSILIPYVSSTTPAERICIAACYTYEIDYIEVTDIILGGEEAQFDEFPHLGAIGWRSKTDGQWVFKCAGSLINERFLITAAHCSWLSLRHHHDVVNNIPEIVRFGVKNIEDINTNVNGSLTDAYIKQIIKHPKYKPTMKYYDIALIELRDDVTFNLLVHPACLWTELEISESELIIAGWGVTDEGTPSPHLQKALVENLNISQCDDLLMSYRSRKWNGFSDHQMCAGKLGGKIDTCQGDSGSALQIRLPHSSLYYIIGVTSFGIGCGKENHPGVYTRISSFIDWIEENAW